MIEWEGAKICFIGQIFALDTSFTKTATLLSSHGGFQTHHEEEEKAGCFAIIVLQMYCYYKCSVALPHGAVGCSTVCDCGIF